VARGIKYFDEDDFNRPLSDENIGNVLVGTKYGVRLVLNK
jgi:hypothetical protein